MRTISVYMLPQDISAYVQTQEKRLKSALASLEASWDHSRHVASLLDSAIAELRRIQETVSECSSSGRYHMERKIDKYTEWFEVFRLVYYQYGRYSNQRRGLSEGLYSTVLHLAVKHSNSTPSAIVDIGCGPGRLAGELALLFPAAYTLGLDYSLLSLILARRIVNGKGVVVIPRRSVREEGISELLDINGWALPAVEFGLYDLMADYRMPRLFDLVVCANTLNLLPNPLLGLEHLARLLAPNGVLVVADLLGWRIDRTKEQTALPTRSTIERYLSHLGMNIIESFCGGPYVEEENCERVNVYTEHFLVARKRAGGGTT